jgi:hypothetical protein
MPGSVILGFKKHMITRLEEGGTRAKVAFMEATDLVPEGSSRAAALLALHPRCADLEWLASAEDRAGCGDVTVDTEKLAHLQAAVDVYDRARRKATLEGLMAAVRSVADLKVEILIVVGMLDHLGIMGSDPMLIDLPGAHRFYLDPPAEAFLYRLFTTLATDILSHGEQDPFWTDLATGEAALPGSDFAVKDAKAMRQWHRDNQYIVADSVPKVAGMVLQVVSTTVAESRRRGTCVWMSPSAWEASIQKPK